MQTLYSVLQLRDKVDITKNNPGVSNVFNLEFAVQNHMDKALMNTQGSIWTFICFNIEDSSSCILNYIIESTI
jgi:hypothetical protein